MGYPGTEINHFEDTIELTEGLCYDIVTAQATCNKTLEDGGPGCIKQFDMSKQNCPDFFRFPQFSTCKNDCPGVRSFGIIGGGAVLFAATSLAGSAILPFVGIGAAAGGGSLATCSPPFCRARSRQCCLLQFGRRGRVVCPRSC